MSQELTLQIVLQRGRVKKTRRCWLWTAKLDRDGYAILSDGRRAARLVYGLTKGPIPKKIVVRHSCHTKECVRPSHLKRGTHFQNLKDDYYRGENTHPYQRKLREFAEWAAKRYPHDRGKARTAARRKWKRFETRIAFHVKALMKKCDDDADPWGPCGMTRDGARRYILEIEAETGKKYSPLVRDECEAKNTLRAYQAWTRAAFLESQVLDKKQKGRRH